MAVPDPLPSNRLPDEHAPARLGRRYVRAMRVAGLLSLSITGVAVTLIAKGGDGAKVQMLIAAALGVGFSVMLAAAMMLIFLNNKAAGDGPPLDKKERP